MDFTLGTTRGTTHISMVGECRTMDMDMLAGMTLGILHGDGVDGTLHFTAEALHTGITQVATTMVAGTVDIMVVVMDMDIMMDTMQDLIEVDRAEVYRATELVVEVDRLHQEQLRQEVV